MRVPHTTVPIFQKALTTAAASQCWRTLDKLNDSFKLGIKFNQVEKYATLPNKSVIKLIGANDERSLDKARGEGFPEAIVDEAGTYPPALLKRLLEDVLEPATIDYDGTIVLTGTPGPVLKGPFFDACHGEMGYNVHHWDFFSNPHFPGDVKQWADAALARNKWTWDHATVRREWLGLWVYDAEAGVYKFSRTVNLAEGPRPTDLTWVIAVDPGFVDACGFVVIGYRRQEVRIVEAFKKTGLIPSQVAVETEKLRQKYDTNIIVYDTGGYGKGPAVEFASRYNIPIIGATKKDKRGYIELFNADMLSGIIQLEPAGTEELQEEYANHVWADAVLRDKEFEGSENHLCDAALYGVRYCHQHMGDDIKELPPLGSAERGEMEMDAIWADESRVLQEEEEREDDGSWVPYVDRDRFW